MHSRRSFIEKTAKGLTLSTIGLAAPSALFSGSIGDKPKIIGIIGAENSHTIHYGKMFNIEKRFPGFEAKYVWGETAALAERAKEKGGIPTIVKDPNEMLGKIDALIVDHRRGDQQWGHHRGAGGGVGRETLAGCRGAAAARLAAPLCFACLC